MFDYLQIYEPRERLLVGSVDALLGGLMAPTRLLPRRPPQGPPQRILLLRLERIGDLLMTMAALEAVRERAPAATIHLVVGSWNAAVADLLPWVDSYETLDASWLSRHASGNSPAALAGRAWGWRANRFDLAMNFEPDIRSNLLTRLSGAPRRVGFRSGGGASLLTDAVDYDPSQHSATNLVRLVDTALPATAPQAPKAPACLRVPDAARDQANALLRGMPQHAVKVGMHVGGGRAVKQWDPERFAEVAGRVSRKHKAAIVFTGTSDERPLVNRTIARLPPDIPFTNLAGEMALDVFAAVLEQLSLLVTGDTGPMHLAAAVRTPVVAIFGPSDPVRYGPLADRARVLTADLWCRPCNRIRRPPERCAAGIPDCLNAISVETVVDAVSDVLG